MSAAREDFLPTIPDRPDTEEFLGIVIEDGREQGVRERVNACSTYQLALADAQRAADRSNRSGPGNAYALVLRRQLGPWELAD